MISSTLNYQNKEYIMRFLLILSISYLMEWYEDVKNNIVL